MGIADPAADAVGAWTYLGGDVIPPSVWQQLPDAVVYSMQRQSLSARSGGGGGGAAAAAGSGTVEPLIPATSAAADWEEGAQGLDAAVFRSVAGIEPSVRQAVMSDITLSGGGSLLEGLAPRVGLSFQLNFKARYPTDAMPAVDVSHVPERRHLPWLGASICASLPDFVNMNVSKADYAEHGARAIHWKCF
eukprot:TRINITY_DN5023_c0_g1_i1.p1 TRINITY_DN5023_c0_g1~~TRINITY_DN5023_c0_g1_i1.p1  ORF type:complete len:191 (-),score=50.43 TRINITY_DN5023_c0_g1_i1:119-691(-)